MTSDIAKQQMQRLLPLFTGSTCTDGGIENDGIFLSGRLIP